MPRTYLVGGAVRDHLLGIQAKDRDYVVVGATPEYMLEKGFKQVGSAFPVFLHPETGEEYALARREKKTAPGYHGFEVDCSTDVSLVDDLERRDLTINSMALDEANGQLHDPFGGMHDLEKKILRHTSSAFSEDPLRVLRLARFAARYNFDVDAYTLAHCRLMVEKGELHHLSPDRVAVEFMKMLDEGFVSHGIQVLRQTSALTIPMIQQWFHDAPRRGSHRLEDKMSREERAYWFTSISEMTNKTLQALRVPTDLHRRTTMFSHVVMITQLDEKVEESVTFFDRFRSDLSKDVRNALQKFALSLPGNDRNHVFTLMDVVEKLLALNFTDAVVGMKPEDIKAFVRRTKEEVARCVIGTKIETTH